MMNTKKQSRGAPGSFRLPSWTQSKLLKAAISVLLLGLLLYKINLGNLARSLSHVNGAWLALGVLVFFTANLASVYKWRLILKAQRINVSFPYLLSLFYIGLFFNNFLPSSVGGDVVRIFKLSRKTGRALEATSSVAMDRATSSIGLLVIAAAVAIFQARLLGWQFMTLLGAMIAVALALTWLVISEKAALRLGGIFRMDPLGARRHLVNFYYSLHQFQKQRARVAEVMAVSLVYQSLAIVLVYFLARSLGIHLAVYYYFLFIPIVLAVSMIPISLNGLGMREGAWVLLFSHVGVSAAAAFSMSILSLMVLTAVSMSGGVLYLADRTAPAQEAEIEEG